MRRIDLTDGGGRAGGGDGGGGPGRGAGRTREEAAHSPGKAALHGGRGRVRPVATEGFQSLQYNPNLSPHKHNTVNIDGRRDRRTRRGYNGGWGTGRRPGRGGVISGEGRPSARVRLPDSPGDDSVTRSPGARRVRRGDRGEGRGARQHNPRWDGLNPRV